MAIANSDYYVTPWASETSELLEKKGFVNTEDLIDDCRSDFHLFINKRRSVFFIVDNENLQKTRLFTENLGEKLNPTTLNEIEQWQK